MLEKLKKNMFWAVCLIVAALGLIAYIVLSPTVVKLPSAPPSVLTAEEYHQAETYCKSNGLEVEVSTHNKWIFAVSCKRADGLLLAIPKAQSAPADKPFREKIESMLNSTAPTVPPAASGLSDSKPPL